jgi:SsrA-binding protein
MNETNGQGIKIIVNNRKARYDYEIIDTFEAGMVLYGTEVKALREGKANLKDSFAYIDKNQEVFLNNLHISPYEQANLFNHNPERVRKLLLHRMEIRRLVGRTTQQGLTLVPLKLYFKRGKAKVELALVRGKKQFDKRHAIAERTAQRDIDRAVKERTQ